jgi:hypothetical protein
VKLTTHIHIVPRSSMRGAVFPFPQYVFMKWCSVKGQGQLYLYLYHKLDSLCNDIFSPQYGESSRSGWRRRPPNMKGSC